MKDKVLNMDKRILAVFIVLFLSNVLLWFYLLSFYSGGFNFDLGKLSHIFITGSIFYTIVSVLIFFAFITSTLPKLLALGKNPSYEIFYLLVLGLLSLSMAYFYSSVNQSINLAPCVTMVNLLAIILVVLIVASRFKSFRALGTGDYTRKDQLKSLVVFLILGFLSTVVLMQIHKFDGNIRIMIVMTAGLFGGPMIGIPTAVLSSLILLANGGGTAVCFAVSTIVCGVISSAVYVWNGRKFLETLPSIVLVFLFIGFDMLMIVLMTPASSGVPMVLEIYLPMLFAGLMGIMLFQIIAAEIKIDDGEGRFDAQSEINELKASLKEHEKKIKQLEELEKE